MFVSSGFGQAAPEQGPPPRNLVRQPDGHFTANSEPANPEKFEVRIVKAGDTLSMIAGEVLKNPRLWPQLWEQNEHIVNPHWIYPDDKILIRPITLITESTPPPPPPEPPAPPPQVLPQRLPVPETEPAPEPAPAPPQQGIFQLVDSRPVPEVKDSDLYCSGIIRRVLVPDNLRVVGKFRENLSVLAVESDYVYLGQGSEDGVVNGNSYQVVRETRTVTNPYGRTKDERTLGMHYLDVAQVTVVMAQPAFSLARVVRNCDDAVEVGDILIPFQRITFPTLPQRRPFSPLIQAAGDIKGTVVITKDALTNYGSVMKMSGSIPGVTGGHLEPLSRGVGHEGTIVYVDIGQGQNVRPGDLFIVYKYVDLDSRLYHLPSDSKKIIGARTAVGEIVILKVGERASTALVTYASDTISLGDVVERR
jgi:hypothetical protein